MSDNPMIAMGRRGALAEHGIGSPPKTTPLFATAPTTTTARAAGGLPTGRLSVAQARRIAGTTTPRSARRPAGAGGTQRLALPDGQSITRLAGGRTIVVGEQAGAAFMAARKAYMADKRAGLMDDMVATAHAALLKPKARTRGGEIR
jgi:hypothetical protein